MSKQILRSSSIGLCIDAYGNYFMQVIANECEYEKLERQDVFIPIGAKEARRLSKELKIEISKSYERETISLLYYDVVAPLQLNVDKEKQ